MSISNDLNTIELYGCHGFSLKTESPRNAHRFVNLKCSEIDRRCTVCRIGARIGNREMIDSDQMRTPHDVGRVRPLSSDGAAQARSQLQTAGRYTGVTLI